MKTTFVRVRTTRLLHSVPPCRITAVTIRFSLGETGRLKVLGRSHIGDSFAQNGVDFLH
jgi:CRISPR/Cas system-associated protein Cas10 (large subunit of type III CRISPR-Cas system)